MSQTSATSPSSLNYQSIFDNALVTYRKKTGKDLRSDPLLAKLETCGSPDAVLTALRDQLPGFDQPEGSDDKLTRWLDPTVNVLLAFSSIIGAGASLAYSPAGAIFSGFGVLLSAVKDVGASGDALADLFGRIEGFFRRLEAYIELPSIAGMSDTIVKIMAEMLSILGIATKEIKRSKAKKFIRRLAGKTDIDDALRRLEKLSQEEGWMAAAQGLKATHGAEVRIGSEVRGVGNQVIDRVENLRVHIEKEFRYSSRDNLRDFMRTWLSPPDPSVNLNTADDVRHEGTSRWFLESSAYHEWKASNPLLWIHGKPGSGKTVITSAIIQDIEAASKAGSANITYFFFDFKDVRKQDARALLSSVLVQLSNQSDPFCDILIALYSTHHRGSQQPSDLELAQCLEDMLEVPGQAPIYIIIDALDECPNTTGIRSPREKVLALVKKLVDLNLPNLRLCITSRPEIDIRKSVEPLAPNRISLNDESGQRKDILDFVSSVVYSLQNLRKWREEDKISVIRSLSDRADGMFRWVFCQLEILRQCFPSSVRRILEELPETLDETYERILQEIPKPNREHAVRLLQCLAVVVRPLRVEELADVLAVDFSAAGGIPKLNEDLRWEDQEQAVLSACSSLITIVKDRDSRIVQFSHFSVKEFLMSGRLAASNANALCYYHIRLESAHTIMAQACLGVLLRLDGPSDDLIDDYSRVEEFPLARYAADHFGDHAEFGNVISHIEDGIDDLLDAEKPYLAEWLWIRRNDSLWSHKPQAVPLYYVAEFGFCGLAQRLISTRPQDLDTLGRSSGNPLHAAVYNEQAEVLRLLIGHCEDVNVRGFRNWTPLHLAVSRGSFEVVQILVDRGADINSLDEKGQAPLHRILDPVDHSYYEWYPDPYFESEAVVPSMESRSFDEVWYPDPYDCWYPDLCEDPYLDQVSFLLERGADVDAQDNDYLSPLHIASSRGMPNVVKLLLEHGASVHVRNNQGQTPLHRSLEEPDFMFQARYFDVIRMLLAHGVDVDAQDNNCSTPLHMASCVRSLEAVQMLLGHGANVHARNTHGETPLHKAVTRRVHKPRDDHFDVIRLLLAHSADLHAQDSEGSTPLHIASHKGTFKDVQILLERGANVHSKDKSGQTPLHKAIRKEKYTSGDGYFDVIRILLAHCADVEARDDDRQSTPLHLASFSGNLKAAQMLLERGANVHARDAYGSTPLCDSLKGYEHNDDIAAMLLAYGADVDPPDNDYTTPLLLASYNGSPNVVQMLLDHGANVHARQDDGQTPLHRSLLGHNKYNDDVMRILLARGADVDSQDEYHSTPLHLASNSGKPDTVQILLEHGANVHARNDSGRTPLHLSLMERHPYHDDIAPLLLAHGANVDPQDNDHSTPLHFAAYHGRLDIVQMLLEHGANVHSRNNNGRTPLHQSLAQHIYDRDDEVARLLLAHGASVDPQDNDQSIPLHLASFNGCLKAVQMLLELGANVHARNKNGQTPLHQLFVGYGCNADIARMLLAFGADVDPQDNDHSTPLHFASHMGDPRAIEVLLERGADVRARNNSGRTPLHQFLEGYQTDDEIAGLFLSRGADVDSQDNKHLTPLHLASFQGMHKAVQMLLERGANVHARNKDGRTPLHQLSSSFQYNDDRARTLVAYGADIEAQDNDLLTPLLLASRDGKLQAVRGLLEIGANVHARDSNGRTPLHQAFAGGGWNDDIVRRLLARGTNVDALDNSHSTPLHLASSKECQNAIRLLLDHGADVRLENNMGETPVQIASAQGHQVVIRLLSGHAQSERKM